MLSRRRSPWPSRRCGPPALRRSQVLNLYSARHYQTDEALYANFTKATGIRSTASMPTMPASSRA